jgi:hypothetical protein
MKDARAIIKMQTDALRDFPKEIDNLKTEIYRLTPMAKYNFSEDKLVKVVNNIVHDSYGIDWNDSEEADHEYVEMIRTLLEFGNMLPGQYSVLIDSSVKYAPKLVKK